MNTARLPLDPARLPAIALAIRCYGVDLGSRPYRVQPFPTLFGWMRGPATA